MPPKAASKIPPSRPNPISTRYTQSTDSARPAASAQAVLTNATARSTDLYKKRRTGLWAVGVAVIVGAGAILGAQLKTRQQAKGRFERNIITVDEDGQSPPFSTTAMDTQTDASTETNPPARAGSPVDHNVVGVPSNAGSATYNQRQISFLEDRRGVLMKQKFELEKKIQRVREKERREEEIEGRRAVSADGER